MSGHLGPLITINSRFCLFTSWFGGLQSYSGCNIRGFDGSGGSYYAALFCDIILLSSLKMFMQNIFSNPPDYKIVL